MFWRHRTRIGVFEIRRDADGRWRPRCNGEPLGSYATPEQALDDLVGGSTDWPGLTNPATLGLPDELGQWEKVAG